LRRFGAFIGEAAVNHPNEFIVAVATVWLAIFTGVLAIATVRLWNSTAHLAKIAAEQSRDMKYSIAAAETSARAAELSARATVGVELPIVFLQRIDVMGKGYSPGVIPSLPPAPSEIWVWFKNYGRTPAILLHLFIDWDVISRLSDEPDYQRLYPLDGVIEPGDTFEFRTASDVIFDQAQIEAANRGTERFWVYGYLAYVDFVRNQHRVGFCAVWASVKDGPFHLMQAGTDKYIYQK
jgi:hypothetical protein